MLITRSYTVFRPHKLKPFKVNGSAKNRGWVYALKYRYLLYVNKKILRIFTAVHFPRKVRTKSALRHARARARAHTHTHTHTCTTHTRIHIHTHARTHIHTHARTHARTRARARTHSWVVFCSRVTSFAVEYEVCVYLTNPKSNASETERGP